MVEGTRYKITLNFSGIETLEDYAVYGACQGLKCCSPAIPLTIGESIGSSVPVFVEPMKNGSYRYQIFLKRLSTNLEFLILQGRIEVSNRIGSENGSNCPQNAIIDTVLNSDNVTVNVTVQEGSKGADGKDGKDGAKGDKGEPGQRGEKGDKGDKGEPFTYADFTPEQLATLKGQKGDQGQRGEKGQPGQGASLDYIVANPKDYYKGKPIITPNKDGSFENNLLIGEGINVIGGGNTVIGLGASVANANDNYSEGSGVAIGVVAKANGYNSVAVGTGAAARTTYSVAIGGAANVNDISPESIAIGSSANVYNSYGVSMGHNSNNNGWGVTIGHSAWTANDAVAIGCSAGADGYGLALGNNAYAENGNITLKSGNVQVKFSADGMTLNGEPYGNNGGASAADILKIALNLENYNAKYQDINLYDLRNSGSTWVDNKNGYSGDWYSYYNDLTPEGDWVYSLSMTDEKAASYTFNNCPWIKRFVAKIDEPTEGGAKYEYMFRDSNLEEFYTPSKIRKCDAMFVGATKLEKFYADLSELRDGDRMFGQDSYNCSKLNLQSVENIADTIGNYWGSIFIGMAYELQFDYGDGYYECQEALQKIRDKGWTVYQIYSDN